MKTTTRRGANHGLHLALTVLSCGLWAVTGWPIAAAMGRRTTVEYRPDSAYPPMPPYAYPPMPPYAQPPATNPGQWQPPVQRQSLPVRPVPPVVPLPRSEGDPRSFYSYTPPAGYGTWPPQEWRS